MGPRQHVRHTLAVAIRSTAVFFAACTLVTAQSLPTSMGRRCRRRPNAQVAAPRTAAVSFTNDAAGTDIWDTGDQFHFVYQPYLGRRRGHRAGAERHQSARLVEGRRDRPFVAGRECAARLRARLGGQGRQLPAPHLEPARPRSATAASTTAVPPAWVRAVRSGTKVTTYWSTNGTTWTTMGSVTLTR